MSSRRRWFFFALLVGICLPRALSRSANALSSSEEKRLQRMKFAEIVSALGAREGRHIADVGAGEGTFSAALARVAGPQGKIYAVDIREEALKRLRKRVGDNGLGRYPEVIRHVLDSLKPGARLVVVDYLPHRTRLRPRADQVKNHVLAPEIVERELKGAGFVIVERRDSLVDNPDEESAFWIITAERPALGAG